MVGIAEQIQIIDVAEAYGFTRTDRFKKRCKEVGLLELVPALNKRKGKINSEEIVIIQNVLGSREVFDKMVRRKKNQVWALFEQSTGNLFAIFDSFSFATNFLNQKVNAIERQGLDPIPRLLELNNRV